MDEMLNQVHHRDWLHNGLPDKCAQLIIADPPYFEVKGDFDFIWPSFDAYLEDVDKWARECSRVLADNGSLFWWGHARKIAYSQIVLDRYFSLLNNIVWEKVDCQTNKNEVAMLRAFAPVTERLLFYDKGEDKSGNEMIHASPELFQDIKRYLDEEHEKTGLSLSEMCDKFGSVCSHYFGFSKRDKTQFHFPTAEMFAKLQTTGYFNRSGNDYQSLRTEYESLRQQYEKLREEYEALRRPFNLYEMQNDVFKFSQESHITKHYDHDTKKPESLTRLLIQATTKPGDLVVIPFAGSGTECAMAIHEGRRCIGFDIDAKHVNTSNKRVRKHLATPQLFYQ